MSKKKIEPTEAMVEGVEHARKFLVLDVRTILRTALNHPDAPGLFADGDTIRAALEQGWDQATRWIDSYQGGPNGRTDSARSANPHRPVQELPTEDGAVIVPADGREFIEASGPNGAAAQYCREAVYVAPYYYGVWWRDGKAVHNGWRAKNITPGTWQVADQ